MWGLISGRPAELSPTSTPSEIKSLLKTRGGQFYVNASFFESNRKIVVNRIE